MNCGDVTQLLLGYLDDELSPKERESVKTHLSLCSNCRDEMEALANTIKELRQGLTVVAAGTSPSPYAWEAIKGQISEKDHGRISIPSPRGWLSDIRERMGVNAKRWASATACLALIAVLIVSTLVFLPNLRSTDNTLGPLQVSGDLTDSPLEKFASFKELNEFAKTVPETDYDGAINDTFEVLEGSMVAPKGASQLDGSSNETTPLDSDDTGYSGTNVQVDGVDEADIVKTDGKCIYTVVDNSLIIVNAYPSKSAQILSKIELDHDITSIFINKDKLVVFESLREYGKHDHEDTYYHWGADYATSVKVYDISDKSNPVLDNEITVDGSYWDSRMIGNYVYVIAVQTAYYLNDVVELPQICLDDTVLEIPAEEVLHTSQNEYDSNFVTILSFDVNRVIEDTSQLGFGSFFLGSSSKLYMSQNNMYLTCNEYDAAVSYRSTTAIHRIHLDDGKMEYNASSRVPGRVLNQFSMDEYDSYFRLATTTGSTWDNSSGNHLYVLDDNMDNIGALENIAPGERIYSARFMGDRCYLVTFKEVDPFFVIDVSNPSSPKVLGELKITGYSDYLHPYDQDHIIGIGKETVDGLYQGVKISLFDVSDVSNPREISKYEIGDRGTDSPILDDHKALLFDREKNLLVMPVLVMEQWTSTWQGAYVFDISVEKGLVLHGMVTHYDDAEQTKWYYDSQLEVRRTLYIGDTLYTLSDAKIKMNDLTRLDYVNEVSLL